MTRCFWFYIFGIVLSVSAMNSYAELNSGSIVNNQDVNACIERNSDSECLSSVSKLMEERLNSVYQNKLKEISTYDYSQWWMGEKEQREEMRKSFIRSQELWLKYRQNYCKSASTGAESIDGYGAIVLSCQINMGIRRIEEIRMIHPDLSDG